MNARCGLPLSFLGSGQIAQPQPVSALMVVAANGHFSRLDYSFCAVLYRCRLDVAAFDSPSCALSWPPFLCYLGFLIDGYVPSIPISAL